MRLATGVSVFAYVTATMGGAGGPASFAQAVNWSWVLSQSLPKSDGPWRYIHSACSAAGA